MIEPGIVGRIKRPPHPLLVELLYGPNLLSDLEHALPLLLDIDAAHVVMLTRCGLLSGVVGARLVELNRELAAQYVQGKKAVGLLPTQHRGVYLHYEHLLIDRLGPEVGGAAHIARSRNDINATVARMRLRTVVLSILADIAKLEESLGLAASEYSETLMSGFTHLQPAQPTTFGHYLTAVLSEITRTAEWLSQAYENVDRCPMGSAAGMGTAFPIDQKMVAHLLGFASVIDNSTDAVASRDYVLQVLSALATLGTTLTRFALDLQTWGSLAYGFLDWPDDVMSTSSIMPQKRNAFVLENVRGKAAGAIGGLVSAITGLKNTPFANSVEVSSEATSHVWVAAESTATAVRLINLLVQTVIVNKKRMQQFVAETDITMTALADLLVAEHGIAFRSAHDAVSVLASEQIARLIDVEMITRRLEEVLASAGHRVTLNVQSVAGALDAEACMRATAYGGGPCPTSVRRQLDELRERWHALEQSMKDRRIRLQISAEELQSSIRRLKEEVSL